MLTWLTSYATCDASHCSLSLGEASSGRGLRRLLPGWEAARCVQGTLATAAGVCSAAMGLSSWASCVASAAAAGVPATGGLIALGEPRSETGESAAACIKSVFSWTLQHRWPLRLNKVRNACNANCRGCRSPSEA